MTPRGVQVWFQNRRAKTKQQAKKAEAAAASSKSSDPSATSAAASANPPIAPKPDDDDAADDAEDVDDPSSALPTSPRPPQSSEDPAREHAATADGAHPSSIPDNEQSNPPSDSRRGSLAHPRAGWPSPTPPASSPSVSTAPVSTSAPSSSELSSPSPANSSHVRLPTHPPSATSSYSHNHLAPTEIYSQRRTSLPPTFSSNGLSAGMGINMLNRRRGGYDPNARRRSTDLGGHRIVAHPYISVAQSANGPHSHLYADGEDGGHPQQQIRRPALQQRLTAPFVSSLHSSNAQAMHSPQPQGHRLHAHSQPTLPTQAQQRAQPVPRQHYDISPIQVSVSQGYNQPPAHPGYDLFAPRHSIDGSALGLSQAHAQMGMGIAPLHSAGMDTNEAFNMGLGMGSASMQRGGYAISQRPAPATIPGPLPSPNFSFGNPFAPANGSSSSSTSNSASGTPPNGASPPMLSMRRTSESGVSDGDTEESSGAPLSRFGSIASINGSEGSWTSAYVSENSAEGEEGNICDSRRMSCASEFVGMFSEMEVGSNGGTPAPHGMQDQHTLRHAHSSSHLSTSPYATHQAQVHTPEDQQSHMHAPGDADGYPSPSSASTVSAGSNNGGHQHTISHDTTQHQHQQPQQHQPVASGSRIQGQNHPRTNTSSELAYALQGAPEPTHTYQQHPQAHQGEDDGTQLQYPMYSQQPDNGEGEQMSYGYAHDQGHYGSKGQLGHFPTLYEGYVYPHSGADGQIPEEEAGAMNQAYAAAGAIELSHMCVPASEGVHFMGGYMQYS
ncbi:hypothetical protein C8Q77DRAFT_1217839 [Trametes polyzona]|nr:hypothetical protein C8Q77DRAFT_1217839 [Trametes polyzona]